MNTNLTQTPNHTPIDPALITAEDKAPLLYIVGDWGSDTLPEAVTRIINARPDLFKDDLITELKAIISTKRTADNKPDLPLAILYTLSHYQATEAFPLVIEMLQSLNEEQFDAMFGDILLDHGELFLGALFDGNMQLLEQLLTDKQAYFYSKTIALDALSLLVYYGKLDKEAVVVFLDKEARRLIEENKDTPDAEEAELVDWVLMHLAELDYPKAEQIVDSFQWNLSTRNLFDMASMKGEWGEGSQLSYRKEHFDMLQQLIEEGLFFIRNFSGYGRKDEEDWFSPLPAWQGEETVVNGPKIGRNDPCPCGSGKKYKKCCLKNNS